ncbi:MAG: DUF4439 domain-containing protein [Candidatus Xenobia bacterium]
MSDRRKFLTMAALLATAGPAAARLFKKPEGDGPLLAELLSMEQRATFACGMLKGNPRASEDGMTLTKALQQTHHEHASTLVEALRKLGETPPEAQSLYRFDQPSDTEAQVLGLIAHQERTLGEAYIKSMSRFHDRTLATTAGPMLADCSLHLAVLRHTLGLSTVFSWRDLQA